MASARRRALLASRQALVMVQTRAAQAAAGAHGSSLTVRLALKCNSALPISMLPSASEQPAAMHARVAARDAMRRSVASWSAAAVCCLAAGTAATSSAAAQSGASGPSAPSPVSPAGSCGAAGIRPASNQTPWLRRTLSDRTGGGSGSEGDGSGRAKSTWAKAEAAVARDKVVLFSKTTCGYCARVHRLLARLGLGPSDVTTFELDLLPDGAEVQVELHRLTGLYTVPHLFIGGVSFGDSEDVMDAYGSGALREALQDAGVALAEDSDDTGR